MEGDASYSWLDESKDFMGLQVLGVFLWDVLFFSQSSDQLSRT